MCEWKRKPKWSHLEPQGHFLPVKVDWTMVRPLIQRQPILKLNREVWYEKDVGIEDSPKEEPEAKVGKEKWNVQEKYKAEREKVWRGDRKLMRFGSERKSSPVKSQTNMVETTVKRPCCLDAHSTLVSKQLLLALSPSTPVLPRISLSEGYCVFPWFLHP